MSKTARVHVGVGGWTYEPWRDNFFPKGLPHSQELHYASRKLTAIEVNGTFYSTFKPATFAKWRDETPDGFVFSLKAHRSTTNRRELGTAREAIDRFLGSGLDELGDKLGPILWQFMPTKVFAADDFEAFLALLPASLGSNRLRHVLDVRHPSFENAGYLALARRHGCVTVHTDSAKYPNIIDEEAPFAYLRLMRSDAAIATGYPPKDLDDWATGARAWSSGERARDAFVFFINGAKEKAPAAAMEFIARLA
ncbi:MAG: FIG003003: hypothetical protein [uncultured Ramlibacter sp.]|uniref:DUF72 domain-containing protein n=1 Tax=uncultured Ramlibacter sp. TaxID=260755 RepID=A0A6J4PKM5_9BURK|nr:MAG: FIG003003: hypothetical protein [uncultured Ramlibacter sp.]